MPPLHSLIILLSLVSLTCLTGVGQVHASQGSAEGTFDWWTPSYLADYALLAGGYATYKIGGATDARSRALIGPSYDPQNPQALFDFSAVAAPYRDEGHGETVPTIWIYRLITLGAVSVGGIEAVEWGAGRGSMHQFHDTFVGYAESVVLTAAITEVSKPLVGRLRPDFGERSRRHHCAMEPDLLGDHCRGYTGRPLHEDPQIAQEILDDGRRSFISGHSSHSFSLFGYTALVIGGRYVWGQDASDRSQLAGLAAQSALMGAASYVTFSRIHDGRHHLTDVIAGILVGTAAANLAYWRRFDRQGGLRNAEGAAMQHQTLQTTPPYLGLSWTFQR